MVILNRIYTRTGDDGTTALGSGERRAKYDLRVSAYGTVDETNAAIGVARLHLGDTPAIDGMLGRVQNDLFDLGADLAVPQREGKAERLRVLASCAPRAGHRHAERRSGPADVVCFAWRNSGRSPSASGSHHLPQGGTDRGGTGIPARRAGE